jgi:NADH dehydrogenase
LAELRGRIDDVILVTGAAGFVGGHVVHALRADDRPVRALVRDRRKAGQRFEAWGCEVVEGDITKPETLGPALAGCDAVIHLVAIRQGRAEEFERVMVDGTRNLIAAAHEAGAGRFVHMSALGVGEETKDLVPYYGAKWQMELDVKAAEFPHVIFRPSFIFAKDGGILPTFAKLARITPVTPIPGSGRQRIQPIWADDVGAYFSKAVDLGAATGRTFELGGPDAVSWNEFWRRLKRTRGMRRPSLHMPMSLMRMNALVTERLPGNIPLTRDLLKMLETGDNIVTDTSAVDVFGLPLVALDEQLRRAVA